jgi:hypothetical protein
VIEGFCPRPRFGSMLDIDLDLSAMRYIEVERLHRNGRISCVFGAAEIKRVNGACDREESSS